MTNEELNTALYKKAFAEQEKYRDWLLRQSPEEILSHTYEYTVREDILLSFESEDLSDSQALALLSSPSLIADIFHDFERLETDYMQTIHTCIEDCADNRIAIDQAPLYTQSATYAREHNEIDAYRNSRKANIACKEAIEDAIRENYHNNRLDTSCVGRIADRFGIDRVQYVLANTVQQKSWDERFSRSNHSWAESVTVAEDGNEFVGDRRTAFVVDRSHPGLTDLFVTAFRRDVLHEKRERSIPREERDSVLALLKQPLPVQAEPTPHKSRSMER